MPTDNENYISLRRLGEFKELLDRYKQDKLAVGTNLDNGVKSGSLNPITSNGVYNAIYETMDGAKNLFNQSESYALEHISNDNGVYTTLNDTLATLRLQITKYLNGSLVEHVTQQLITSNGVYHWEFTKDSTFDSFMIGHNGSTYNGRFRYNLGKLENGRKYVIRIDITRCSDSNGSFQWRDIMICSKEAWDAGFTSYQPYALPNTTITPALIKQVDEGDKNLLSVNSIVYTGESAGWKVADISPYIASGTYKISCNIERPSGSVAGVQVWCKYTDDTTEMVVPNTQAASVVSTITFSKKVKQLSIYCTSTATVKNIMICTTEDWAVSHKFVPYAPTNSIKLMYNGFPGENSRTVTYQMTSADFTHNGDASHYCGIYLIVVVNWSTSPSPSIYTACYSGGTVAYHALTKIGGADAQLTIDEDSVITYTGKGKIQIYALQ